MNDAGACGIEDAMGREYTKVAPRGRELEEEDDDDDEDEQKPFAVRGRPFPSMCVEPREHTFTFATPLKSPQRSARARWHEPPR
mmetsp:Transcript_2079/g.4606  ORF Transcript_2079/g.4606 Transcript_2079/m.4606 type:complete len:84 (-) Transcript_2079:46-297(-)